LVVKLGLDCQRSLVEPPDLGVSAIWSLDYHVSVVDNFEVSVGIQSRDNVEWSLNVHAELFIKFALSWFTLPFVNIHNFPLLMDSSVLGFITLDVSSFRIGSSLNVEVFVHTLLEGSNVRSLDSEQLPPS